jgi:hypothetical protein
MRRMLRRRPSPAMVIALIALFLGLGGTATALNGRNIIFSNDIAPGQVKKPDVGRDAVGKSEVIDDNNAGGGLSGFQINEGTLGEVPNAAGLTHWAVVESNGALSRGEGTTSSSRLGTGRYQVLFNRAVSNCAYVATLGRTGSSNPPAGEIGVATLPGSAGNGVAVRTRASGGGLADRPFHLVVNC